MLINLVKNSREAGSEEDDIAVRVTRRDGGSALVVEDRGAGMNDETLGHALLPFYSTKPGGTGLGLALAGNIVDAHGGTIRIGRRERGRDHRHLLDSGCVAPCGDAMRNAIR